MNLDSEDPDVADVLSAVGQVNPPSPDALGKAQEVLWSAVTEEMLSGRGSGAGPEEQQAADRPRRRAGQDRLDVMRHDSQG